MVSFDDVVKKVGEAAGVVASTTEKAVSIGKRKYNIAALENKINKCYNQLGQIYFEMAKNDENAESSVKELIKEIETAMSQIEAERAEIEELK